MSDRTDLNAVQAKAVIAKLRQLLQSYFAHHGLKAAVFGKSEGLDSSVIAGLLCGIPSIQTIGVVMPIESEPRVREIAHEVLEFFQIPAVEIDLEPQYLKMREAFEASDGVETQLAGMVTADLTESKARALGNIKARLRMMTLYHIAQLTGGAVISTDNYSEYWMGFWTLNGDVGDIAPIQQIFKGDELYAIARELGVPQSSIEAVPSDGLGLTPNNSDEDQLGVPYPLLDKIIEGLLKADFDRLSAPEQAMVVSSITTTLAIPLPKVQRVTDRMRATAFKRKWPVVFTREEIGLAPISVKG